MVIIGEIKMQHQDIKNGRFYLGDCLEAMKEIPDGVVDMLLVHSIMKHSTLGQSHRNNVVFLCPSISTTFLMVLELYGNTIVGKVFVIRMVCKREQSKCCSSLLKHAILPNPT